MAGLSKTTSQQLLHWCIYLGAFCDEMMHILGEENCWDTLPSRWRRVGAEVDDGGLESLNAHTVAAYARADADFTLPSNNAIKASQLEWCRRANKMIP